MELYPAGQSQAQISGHQRGRRRAGTFKDKYIFEQDPHALLEGIIITCYAIGSHKAYVYIRGEYIKSLETVQAAVDEAYKAKYLGKGIMGTGFDIDVVVHPGAGAYICGEETALLESLEGKKGFPRLKPPFPGGGRIIRLSHGHQ